ncbi:MAG TPA: hypothetical protein VM890_11965 [Longimicrobium sp.]|jgi:hypothetical protein|nr:hypothetical protein [Longimicrobium sp.]
MISIVTTLRPRLRAALAVLALAAAGCSDSSLLSANEPNVVPTSMAPFTLVTVNGQALPVEMHKDSTGRVTLAQGELMLGGDGFWQRLTLVDTPPVGLATTRTSIAQGTITVSGTKVHFRASDGAEWDGTASAGGIVYAIPGNAGAVTFSFLRN